jgi:hypothetical protein
MPGTPAANRWVRLGTLECGISVMLLVSRQRCSERGMQHRPIRLADNAQTAEVNRMVVRKSHSKNLPDARIIGGCLDPC